ncbi:MAG: hypothetical protein KF704_03140 [Crocinitomicaceae bacterium]|nr:hypothetical protein [Crocinitomicaceae bacterium]
MSDNKNKNNSPKTTGKQSNSNQGSKAGNESFRRSVETFSKQTNDDLQKGFTNDVRVSKPKK